VVINGSGFGSAQGNSIVELNDTVAQANANAWSDSSVTTSVPSGASSGPLVVCVAPNMNCSNPVTFTVTAPLPNGWLDQDVGSVNTAGSSNYNSGSGTYILTASGQWIWDVADGFHFAYQSLNGDGTIIARVVSVQGSQYPEAGVMIRESLTAGSKHAYITYEPYPGPSVYLYSRSTVSGATAYTTSGIAGLPYWVKLVRSANNFTGYVSSDGVNWVQIGSTQTISMASSVYIGLAVSANNNNAVATATFDNVSITQP
jgi:regulation of enolase protein 1 (concanavalin A-like superfamily)